MTTAESDREALRVHDYLDRSRANGPGLRAVLWLQGCSLGCPGCFNPTTHSPDGGEDVAVDDLLGRLADSGRAIEGLTITGGEPLEQAGPLVTILSRVRSETHLSVVLFTGYAWNEVQASADLVEVTEFTDVVIAGRYEQERRMTAGLRASANQSIHFLTDRYRECDIRSVPGAELVIDEDGVICVTGIDPPAVSGNPI